MTTPTTPPTPETPTPRHDDTLADEMFTEEVITDDGATTVLPTTGATMTETAPAPKIPAPATPSEQQYLSGPAPFALVLGLLGLLVAGSVLVGELTDITLPWGDLGPWSVVAAGLVVLLVGAIGLRSSRSRDTGA
jgi:hypothetical protein